MWGSGEAYLDEFSVPLESPTFALCGLVLPLFLGPITCPLGRSAFLFCDLNLLAPVWVVPNWRGVQCGFFFFVRHVPPPVLV